MPVCKDPEKEKLRIERIKLATRGKPKPSPRKGKTLEQIFGERASEMRSVCIRASKLAADLRRGKTFEEIHGEEHAKELRSMMSSLYKGKTIEEINGPEKAGIRRKRQRDSHLGISTGPFTEEEKEKLSIIALKNILEGRTTPHLNYSSVKRRVETKKAGTIICQSSWEEFYTASLENDDQVLSFEKDKVRIPYLFEGKRRVYIVDFLVTYLSGKKELVELKPSDLLEKEGNPIKFEAARSWCEKNNCSFVVLTEKELEVK